MTFKILSPEEAKKRARAKVADWQRQKEIEEKRAKVEADRAKQHSAENAVTQKFVPLDGNLQSKQKDKKKGQEMQRQERLDRKLINAVKKGNVERIGFLLDTGADPNCMEHSSQGTPIGDTPLILALKSKATSGDKEKVAEILITHGADPNIADDNKNTPLMIVVEDRYALSLAELLIRHGADVNAKRYGESVLKIAARNGYNQMTDLLIEHGAVE